MMRKSLGFIPLLLCHQLIVAQTGPDFNQYILDSNGHITRFTYTCGFFENCNTEKKNLNLETPPWIAAGGNGYKSFFTTNGAASFVSSIDQDIINQNVLDFRSYFGPTLIAQNDQAKCRPAIFVPGQLNVTQQNCGAPGFYKATETIELQDGVDVNATTGEYRFNIVNGLLAGWDWRRNYYNVHAANFINNPYGSGQVTLAFLDAENKKVCYDGELCASTVNKFKPIYTEQPYNCDDGGDFWPTMAAFVCANYTHNTEANHHGHEEFDNDMGPIVWPSLGYSTDDGNNRTSHGVGLPSSIVWDGYIYVFYHDDGPMRLTGEPFIPYEHGRTEGVKVIRAPLAESLNPFAYRSYYKDEAGVVHWNPSLPEGFDKDHMDVFWSEKGPRGTDLMNDVNDVDEHKRFSVAHVTGSNPSLFIGVESYQVKSTGAWEAALRYSNDLLNWSPRQRIIDAGADWEKINMNYPVLCDAYGTSNTEIDLNNFYILGKKGEQDQTNYFYKYHMYLPNARKASPGQLEAFKMAYAGVTPTPNRGIFKVNYSLEGNVKVQIHVMDITGRKVKTINPATKGAGHYSETIDISTLNKGVYVIELVTGDKRQTFKTIKQ